MTPGGARAGAVSAAARVGWLGQPIAAVFVLAAVAGLGPPLRPFTLAGYVVIAGYGCLLTLWRPTLALIVGAAAPLADMVVTETIMVRAASVFLILASLRSWPAADRRARSGALLVLALGVTTMVVGVGLAPVEDAGSGGTTQAVLYATVLGIAAALIQPAARLVAACVATLGCVAGIAALTTPALRVSRTTVVLGENANGVGLFAAAGLVAAAVMLRRTNRLVRLISVGIGVVCLIGLVTTGSRGGMVAAVTGLGALVIHRAIRARPMLVLPAFVGTVGLTAVVSGPLTQKFLELAGRDAASAESNSAHREQALSYALTQGFGHPWTGVGLGRLAEFSLIDPTSGLGLQAHNVYAGTFAESGVLTAGVLILVCALGFTRARTGSIDRLMPLVATVLAGGFFLGWWGATRTGALALFVLGAALGRRDPPTHDPHVIPAARTSTREVPDAAVHRVHADLQPGLHVDPTVRLAGRADDARLRVGRRR